MTLNLSTLLDVALSLVFVFLTLSVFVSGIVEFINTLIERRSKLLQFALEELLGSTTFRKFWDHQLTKIKGQKIAGFWKPISYLSADSFSTVLIHLLVNGKPAPPAPAVPAPATTAPTPTQITLATIRQTIATDPAFALLKPLIEPMLDKTDTLAEFKAALERWYDGYMEQVAGWFKRYAQGVIWAVAVVVTLLFNIDTIKIAKRIASDKTLRANLVSQAEETAKQGLKNGLFSQTPTSSTATATTDSSQKTRVSVAKPLAFDSVFVKYVLERDSLLAVTLSKNRSLTGLDSLRLHDFYLQYLQDNLDALGLPIGWTFPPEATPGQILGKVGETILSWSFFGWILTATALSFGAPFWFELLLKIVNIRNVTRKPISVNDRSLP